MPLDAPFENDDSQPWWQAGTPLRITVHPAPPPTLNQGNGGVSGDVTDQIEPDGYPNDWFVPEPDGYPNDWFVPDNSAIAPNNTSKWTAPTAASTRTPVLFGAIEPDGYPNDWLIPEPDGYPDDWFVPTNSGFPSSNSSKSTAPAAPRTRIPIPFGAIEPDGYPNDWIESDGYPDDWFVPEPDGYPDDWFVPTSSGFPSSNTGKSTAPAAPRTRTPIPFGAIEPDGYPNDWIEPDGFPDDWFAPPLPSNSPQIGTNSPAASSIGPLPQGPSPIPTRSQTLLARWASGINSLNRSPPDFQPLWRILDALNPISPAHAADDEGGGLPLVLFEAILKGLIGEATRRRLAEQDKILREAAAARRELFEVAQGHASSRALARSLEIAGIQRPPGYAAHHIAAGADPRGEFARIVLKEFGIGINDAVNGVFLPANRATQVIAGETIHSTLHTKEYYDAVNQALRDANSRQEVINILRNIALKLQIGDYP